MNLVFRNEGFIIHRNIIVRIKTERQVFLIGQIYENSYFLMFAEDFRGVQGDSNWYHIEANIVWLNE